jgi:subtilisin family serine protease
MRRLRLVLIVVMLNLFSLGVAPGQVPGDMPLLVRLRPGISAAGEVAAFSSLSATITREIPQLDLLSLSVPAGEAEAALAALRQDPAVLYAEPDVRARAALVPDDPGWGQQWALRNIGAPRAWDVARGRPDVVIAVLDTGVTLNHPDLAPGLWKNMGEIASNWQDDDGNSYADDVWGWHFYHAWNGTGFEARADAYVADDHGHGTHVAGIAAAALDNGVGVAGLAGGARLMTLKVLDRYGVGWYSDIAAGIVYAVDNGAHIINMSLGGAEPSQALQDAVDYAHARGVLVVAAAGNGDTGVLYPAACEHVLAVAATDSDDARASFSNHGPQVDVAAPGVDIYSTWYRLDGYFTQSGTSMAAPHVSGLAALIWSADPALSLDQVTHAITSTAVDTNVQSRPGWDEYLGWGRIDAGDALDAIASGLPSPPPVYLPLILHTGPATGRNR